MKTTLIKIGSLSILTLVLIQSSVAQNYFGRSYYLTDSILEANSIENSYENGQVICGYFGYTQVEEQQFPFFAKTDSLGNIVWNKQLDVVASLVDVKRSHDSCYFMVGHIYNQADTEFDLLALKISSEGNIIWSTVINNTGDLRAAQLKTLADGGIILIANTPTQSVLAKLAATGSVEWCKTYTYNLYNYWINSLAANGDSGYVAVGLINEPADPEYSQRLFIMQIDSVGEIIWTKRQGVQNNYRSRAEDIIQTSNGFFLLSHARLLNSHAKLFLQLDHQGTLKAVTKAEGMIDTYRNGKIISNGQAGFHFCNGNGVYKIDTVQNNVIRNDYLFEYIKGCTLGNDGEYCVLGDGPLLILPLKSSIYENHFGIALCDSTGQSECWAGTWSYPIDTFAFTLENINITSSSQWLPGSQEVTASNKPLLDYEGCCVIYHNIHETADEKNNRSILTFPNPANLEIEVKTSSQLEDVEIYDLTGNLRLKIKINKLNPRIDVSDFAPGNYILRATGKDNVWVEKFNVIR